jgi:hypothetical protein
MPSQAPRAPLSVYMLADHLDAALAAGEDLVSRGQDWRALAESPGNMQTFPARQREIVEDIRAFELMLVARLLKASDHAGALATMDPRFAAVAKLFVAGTAGLLDAVEECGDATADDFDTGDAIVAYARNRGLIPADAAAVSNAAQLTIDDNFLVAKRLPLGALMDMAASFLDTLEVQYDLFGTDDETTRPQRSIAEEPEEALDEAVSSAAEAPPATDEVQGDKPASAPPLVQTLPPSPLSKLYAGVMPRREFGQRSRSPLN